MPLERMEGRKKIVRILKIVYRKDRKCLELQRGQAVFKEKDEEKMYKKEGR